MNFVSIVYLVFLAVVVLGLLRIRGGATFLFLGVASLVFYGWWDYRFVPLIVLVGIVAYFGGLLLDRRKSKVLVFVFTALIISPLFYFKYYNFAIQILADISRLADLEPRLPKADVVLPVGVSFFTFQAIGYLIDVYRRDIRAERSMTFVVLFLAYFPQLVAGPIERAHHLIPQLKKLGTGIEAGTNLDAGLFMIMLGIFMKLVLADNLSVFVDAVYSAPGRYTDYDSLLATYFFSAQIYGDFYGYTLIALGSARLMGIDLINNFDHPYFASNIREFWRRWHITLSRWFRDYVYIPLGGSRCSRARHAFNLVFTMVLVGVWHGASYTFLLWGAVHGAMLAGHGVLRLWTARFFEPDQASRRLRIAALVVCVLVPCHCVTFAWVLFRAPDLATAGQVFGKIFNALTALRGFSSANAYTGFYVLVFAAFCVTVSVDRLVDLRTRYVSSPDYLKFAVIMTFFVMSYFAPENEVQFIYFQF